MHKSRRIAHRRGDVITLLLMLTATVGCAIEPADSFSDELPYADTEAVAQGWYSTDPYDQHGWMTYKASREASGYGISWQCSEEWSAGGFWSWLGGEGDYDYTDKLCDTNTWTDDTRAYESFFVDLYGEALAHSSRHHFLRQGSEGAMVACSAAIADMVRATRAGLERREGGWSTWQRPIGTVTHTIQDSFAPAHTRRNSDEPGRLLDLCSIHEDVPGACRHPEPFFPQSEDDADDNHFWRNRAVDATADYLEAVAKMATGEDSSALYPVLAKWFKCPVEPWVYVLL